MPIRWIDLLIQDKWYKKFGQYGRKLPPKLGRFSGVFFEAACRTKANDTLLVDRPVKQH